MLKECFNLSMHSQAGAWERGKDKNKQIKKENVVCKQ